MSRHILVAQNVKNFLARNEVCSNKGRGRWWEIEFEMAGNALTNTKTSL